MKIGIVNTGCANLHSLKFALQSIEQKVLISAERKALMGCDILVLPGVGAFRMAMKHLNELGLNEIILDFVKTGKQLIGICLGMQLLASQSEEFGITNGLNLVSGSVTKLDQSATAKVPNVGWRKTCGYNVVGGFLVPEPKYFYYTHSYQFTPDNNTSIVLVTFHGGKSIVSAISCENVFGAQFHPEKSGKAGLEFLSKLIDLA